MSSDQQNSDKPNKPKTKRLTKRQQAFVDNMANPEIKSATQAAILAGYSEKVAAEVASDNLKKPYISESIEKARNEIAQMAEIDAAEIIRSVSELASTSIIDLFDEHGELDVLRIKEKNLGRFVKKVKITERSTKHGYTKTTEIEGYSRLDALNLLGEYRGIKQLPRENEQKLQNAVRAVLAWLEDYPEDINDLDKVVRTFANGRTVNQEELKAKVQQELGSVH